MQSILLLHTGGTIGMIRSEFGLVPDDHFADKLNEWISRSVGNHVAVTALNPPIDSADAMPAQWESIARTIHQTHEPHCGIVVLHGTDTLAYTASALSFLTHGLNKPIVVTGAQIPFFFPGSDAPANLEEALEASCDPQIHETCVAFEHKLLRGNRSIKFGTGHGDSFVSPHWPELGSFNGSWSLNISCLQPRPDQSVVIPPDGIGKVSIGLVKIFPGFSSRLLRAIADEHPHGVVVELYGSGTAPALDAGLRDAIVSVAKQGIPIVGVSQCLRGVVARPAYVSSRVLNDLGVIAGHDMTSEAALTKLAWLRSGISLPTDLQLTMQKNYAGEVSDVP